MDHSAEYPINPQDEVPNESSIDQNQEQHGIPNDAAMVVVDLSQNDDHHSAAVIDTVDTFENGNRHHFPPAVLTETPTMEVSAQEMQKRTNADNSLAVNQPEACDDDDMTAAPSAILTNKVQNDATPAASGLVIDNSKEHSPDDQCNGGGNICFTLLRYCCMIPLQTVWRCVTSKRVRSVVLRLCKFLSTWSEIIFALTARVFFMAHSAFSVFIVVASSKIPFTYLMFTPIIFLPTEALVTVVIFKNKEWKWFTPSIVIYQLCTVPAIFLMEYQDFNERVSVREANTTEADCGGKTLSFGDLYFSGNFTEMANRVDDFCGCGQCAPITEQLLLLLMIVGRWLIPKSGDVTADQKAQLLLVNIAISADILEFFGMLKDDAVKYNLVLVTIILIFWTISIIQFAIVSTAVTENPPNWCSCFKTEIWSIIILLLLEDIPFLIIRSIIISNFDISSFTGLFFICKNVIVLMLDMYRIGALYVEIKDEGRAETGGDGSSAEGAVVEDNSEAGLTPQSNPDNSSHLNHEFSVLGI